MQIGNYELVISKTEKYIFIILIFAIFLTTFYFHSINLTSGRILTKFQNNCTIQENELYAMCVLRNGNVEKLKERELPNCGETIAARINLDKAALFKDDVPDFYYLCYRGTRLLLKESPMPGNELEFYSYDQEANVEFACSNNLYSKFKGNSFMNVGTLPTNPGNVTFFELYAYPENFTFSTINDFMSNFSLAQKIIGLKGEIIC